MADITFCCPACGQQYTVGEELGGKTGACERCAHEFAIPETSEFDGDVADPVGPEGDPRTLTIVADIVTLVEEFRASESLPWEEQRRLLKHLDRGVVSLREHLEALEEKRKYQAQMQRLQERT